MWYVTSFLVFLCPLCAGASGLVGLTFPPKCGISLSQKQVFDFIFDFSVFRKHVIKTIETTGFPKRSLKQRMQYVQLMRQLGSGIEQRLLGREAKKTRETLNFYADSLRMVRVYQRIQKMLTDDDLLVELVKVCETDLRSTMNTRKQIDDDSRNRMLEVAKKLMTSANVSEKTVGLALVEFSHLVSLANELSDNPTYELFRKVYQATVKSPSLQRMSTAVRPAVTLTLIHQGDSDRPSGEDFERYLKKVGTE